MVAKQKHRIAGNAYNLHRKVAIPIEVQLLDDSAFLHEFSSQLQPGQLGSKSGSDTDTSTDLDIVTLATQEGEDSFDESPSIIRKTFLKNQTDLFN